MDRIGAALWPKLRATQIYGANTNVGKTIVSTLICRESEKHGSGRVHYIKPVSTGPLSDADDNHISRFAKGTLSSTLFQFSKPLSPHLAAKRDGKTLSDAEIQRKLYAELSVRAAQGSGLAVVETAGGVLSPAPSGSSQADLYRPLRLPVVLIGDHNLGGISTTIAAFESLTIRGYDVDAIVLFKDDEFGNSEYLADYLSRHFKGLQAVHELPLPPPKVESSEEDCVNLQRYYEETTNPSANGRSLVGDIIATISSRHAERVDGLEKMAEDAHNSIWYPFTQHQGRTKRDILTIDSAYGDDFQSVNSRGKSGEHETFGNSLIPAVDASASWWTQGLGHGNLNLTLAAGYAAGRYGHVMFASAINKPALDLALTVLKHHKNPRLTKVFYTDNGSTGMEVGIKMALRAACVRYGWDHKKNDISILGLRGSYHGDTMGVMDAAEPSVYNEKIEWYKPRGYWFQYPEVRMRKGKWYVEPPKDIEHIVGPTQEYASLDDILSPTRKETIGKIYEHYIAATIEHLVQKKGYRFGGLVLEPMILGAGGMHFCDPLFQTMLIETVRNNPCLINSQAPPAPPAAEETSNSKDWSGLPIVFDEVFTGLYRLGTFNCNGFLRAEPDVVVNAKLLTGGLVPLCTTAASESIFEAFLSEEKSDALLHGHSYTAHAVGCNVACESLDKLTRMEAEETWRSFQDSWHTAISSRDGVNKTWSMWSLPFVTELSHHTKVDHVFALGSVLAIAVKGGSGYTSTASQGLHKMLLEPRDGWAVHNRVLGNVIYFMTGQLSDQEGVLQLEKRIMECLDSVD